MIFTEEQLAEMIPGNQSISDWYYAMENLLDVYEINTPERVAAFISQCAHESINFKVLKENLNYSLPTLRKVFGKYFPTDEFAKTYVNSPEKQKAIASRVYANRMGNGDESTGDGYKFCGRGLIQLTGRNNYEQFANDIGKPLDEIPDYLGTFYGALESACWFWQKNKLNEIADAGDIKKITRIINGGYNGLDDRIEKYEHSMAVLEA